ncbi:uncharacterized protein [Lolium perenne]|uniref:uncharacterized protein n=1 Tax=Lolium perenne TaxID=4522 RepID=UPI0021F6583F|nr:uncharacterized protein LOC127315817 [Lolium perenne]
MSYQRIPHEQPYPPPGHFGSQPYPPPPDVYPPLHPPHGTSVCTRTELSGKARRVRSQSTRSHFYLTTYSQGRDHFPVGQRLWCTSVYPPSQPQGPHHQPPSGYQGYFNQRQRPYYPPPQLPPPLPRYGTHHDHRRHRRHGATLDS